MDDRWQNTASSAACWWLGFAVGLDREVVSALAASESYYEYEADIRKFKRIQDSPLDQEQNIWKVRAPVVAFDCIGHLIGGDDLDRLKAAATAVFSHIEPMPDPNEPFRLESRSPTKHSEWLRDGLATTLLLVASLADQARLVIPGQSAQDFVEEIVRSLPGLSNDHRVLASLRKELPLLGGSTSPFARGHRAHARGRRHGD